MVADSCLLDIPDQLLAGLAATHDQFLIHIIVKGHIVEEEMLLSRLDSFHIARRQWLENAD
jgi:hypothetical protein